ncbi:MAG: hypothetical protein ACP5XB_05810 [Isosphaeraceae bacterium]
MRLPRISIAGLLLLTAIIACDMAAFVLISRSWYSWYDWEAETFLAVVPFLNILVIALSLLARQVSLQGEATPFLVGFVATGAIALALVLIAQLGFNELRSYKPWAERSLWAFWHEYIEWTGEFTIEHGRSIQVGFDLVAFAAPLLLTALIGGLCTKLAGVSVVRGPGNATSPRAIPVRRARAVVVIAVVLLGAGIWAARVRGRWLEWRRYEEHELSSQNDQVERWTRQEYNRFLELISRAGPAPEQNDRPSGTG